MYTLRLTFAFKPQGWTMAPEGKWTGTYQTDDPTAFFHGFIFGAFWGLRRLQEHRNYIFIRGHGIQTSYEAIEQIYVPDDYRTTIDELRININRIPDLNWTVVRNPEGGFNSITANDYYLQGLLTATTAFNMRITDILQSRIYRNGVGYNINNIELPDVL